MFYRFNQDTLEFQRVKPSTYVKGFILVIIVLITIGFNIVPRPVISTLTPEEKLIIVRESNRFSQKALENNIKSLNFKIPHIVLAQSIQETGNYKSTIFRENHNLFGMKQATIRTNLAKGSNRGHAYYDSWQDSLIDYALYSATYLSDIRTEGEYFEYLRQNYAEDPSYVERLKILIKKRNLKSIFNQS